jgi:type IV secretory pathway VirB9-like protein
VPVGIGFPLDIVFSRGEQVLTFTDGDRAPQADGQSRRWQVGQGADGLGVDQQRQHLFVTVTEPGLRNGLTITTTARRAYYVTLESVKSTPIRVLRWTHAPEPGEGPVGPPPPAGPLPPLDTPMRYHVGYVLESNHPQPPTWLPRGIYDDGRKTYILLPEVTLFESAPLVRLVGVNGPQLVNARMFLNVVILDQLAARLELRLGIGEEAEVVTVTRGRLKTIDCPGSPECPQWPAAASQLARRHP